jgi:hypothetical protein
MTSDSDLERLLDAWFAEGPSRVADRVVDGAADRIARQRQLPAWRLQTWRFPIMSSPLKLILIGAALVAALAAGAILVGGGARLAAPTPSPQTLGDGVLEGGTYVGEVLPTDPMRWTAAVPAGWNASEGWSVSGPHDSGGKAVVIAPILGANVPSDSCDAEGTVPAISVDELVAAVQARDDWTVSEPVDVTVGGYSGRRINLELPKDVTVCGGKRENYMVITEGSEGDGGWWAQGPSNQFHLWVLDVEGRPVVVMRNAYADSPAEQLRQSDDIIDSMVITP